MRLSILTAVAVATFLTLSNIAQADQVELSTGETLTGEILSQTEHAVRLQHPVLGEVAIPRDAITKIHLGKAPAAEEKPVPSEPPADQPKVDAPKESAAPAKPAEDKPLPPDSFLAGWKSQIELSFSGQEGNTENASIRGAFVTKRETEKVRTYFDASIYLATESGDKTSEEATMGIVFEWPIQGIRWFGFADGRFDYNTFEAWDYRINGHGGLGYELVKEKDLTIKVRGGIGALREFGGDSDNDIRPEALAGIDANWKVTEAVTLTANTTIYPDLKDTGEYRIVSGAAAVIAIDKADGLSLKFGVENEYESQTEGDSKHNDLKYYGALVFQF